MELVYIYEFTLRSTPYWHSDYAPPPLERRVNKRFPAPDKHLISDNHSEMKVRSVKKDFRFFSMVFKGVWRLPFALFSSFDTERGF